jgi:hypothetical protein
MRYRIDFLEGLTLPVEISCGKLVVLDRRRLATYAKPTHEPGERSIDVAFACDMSRIVDDQERPIWKSTPS